MKVSILCLTVLLCQTIIIKTNAGAVNYEAIFEITTPSSTPTLLFSNNKGVYSGSTALLPSSQLFTSTVATFTLTELVGYSNDSYRRKIVISEICQGNNVFLFQNNTDGAINKCRNCTQCKKNESLVDSCTTTSDTVCAKVCPLGSISKVVIAGKVNQCTMCPAGTYAPYDSSRCKICAIGYYSDAVGRSSCLQCAQGTTTSSKSGFEICLPVRTLTLFKHAESELFLYILSGSFGQAAASSLFEVYIYTIKNPRIINKNISARGT